MTLQQIDNALAAWHNRLAAVADNLMELQVEPTYQLLTGTGGMTKVPLRGATAARVDPALGAMRTIFDHFGLLHGAIDQAVKLREGLPALFGGDQKLAEIERLLLGKSIQLPAVDIPLEQRSLLSGVRSAECISAEQLLEPMVRAFAAARDAVAAVSHARDDLAAGISNAEAQMHALRAAAPASILDEASRMLAELGAKLQSDPLGALDDLNLRLLPFLTRARQQVEAAEQLRQKTARGRVQMAELAALHREALTAAAEVREKIAACDRLPAPAADEKLAAWLDRLESRRAAGMVDAVTVGLRNWQAAADACMNEEKAALAGSRAPLEARSELRGRVNALKAKARAYGIAEQGPVADLAQQAEALLYARPTDLNRAHAAVVAYEKSLREGRLRV
jgi:hypothetical protein